MPAYNYCSHIAITYLSSSATPLVIFIVSDEYVSSVTFSNHTSVTNAHEQVFEYRQQRLVVSRCHLAAHHLIADYA